MSTRLNIWCMHGRGRRRWSRLDSPAAAWSNDLRRNHCSCRMGPGSWVRGLIPCLPRCLRTGAEPRSNAIHEALEPSKDVAVFCARRVELRHHLGLHLLRHTPKDAGGLVRLRTVEAQPLGPDATREAEQAAQDVAVLRAPRVELENNRLAHILRELLQKLDAGLVQTDAVRVLGDYLRGGDHAGSSQIVIGDLLRACGRGHVPGDHRLSESLQSAEDVPILCAPGIEALYNPALHILRKRPHVGCRFSAHAKARHETLNHVIAACFVPI
mmetsp:Transcript_15378/g.42182  ORF Transcript_15378/g.42182 Transcript_15378/m.42182 type:complete len:270 (+) Transcript_15378:1253-2062(+)